jgi:hypothetical protein
MNTLKVPLVVLTTGLVIGGLDGFFGWDLADGFYTLIGITMIAALVVLNWRVFRG